MMKILLLDSKTSNDLKLMDKLLQTPFPLGFNDNIYHEGNISKMPDFDVLTLSESRNRKSRSHGIRKKGNDKRKRCAIMKLNTSLNDLAVKLRIHGRHSMLSYLSFSTYCCITFLGHRG